MGRPTQFDCRAVRASISSPRWHSWRAYPLLLFSFDRGATPIALHIHLEDGGMMNQSIDRGERHAGVWNDLAHSPKGWLAVIMWN